MDHPVSRLPIPAVLLLQARPAYLARRAAPSAPTPSLDRHYYESWLGRAPLVGSAYGESGVASANGGGSGGHGSGSGAGSGEGCSAGLGLVDCGVGRCGQAKWAEGRLRKARKALDAHFRAAVADRHTTA